MLKIDLDGLSICRWLLFAYNTTYQVAIGCSPFVALRGYKERFSGFIILSGISLNILFVKVTLFVRMLIEPWYPIYGRWKIN